MELMLTALFSRQHDYIATFFQQLDYGQAQCILEALASCQGNILFTGVGKSGFIAEKIAMTLMSTGSRAFYLPPTNALHGDLGILSPNDLIIFISKSGESDELLTLLTFVKARGVQTMAWVSNPHSRLLKGCDLGIVLPLKQELCPFGLSPTTSSALQLIFGDVLAVALMQLKQFSLDQYALNHPAGAIGKRITLKVRDLMLQGAELPLCRAEDQLESVLIELSNKRCGCVLIVSESGELEGIFTDGDLRRSLQNNRAGALHLPLASLMTRTFKSVEPDELAIKALHLMESSEKRVMMLPVVQDKKLVGLIHLHDVLQAGISNPSGAAELEAASAVKA